MHRRACQHDSQRNHVVCVDLFSGALFHLHSARAILTCMRCASTRNASAASLRGRAASQGSARGRGRLRAVCTMAGAADEADVVVCGGGIVAASIAYHLTLRGVKPVVVERIEVGAAASGKAGGFLARGWGDGGPTQALHQVSFDLHEQLAKTLGVSSYRRIPTLSVQTAPNGASSAMSEPPAPWLDGADVVAARNMGGQTAQVTPLELTTKLMDAAVANGATLRRGVVDGIDTRDAADGSRVATAVRVDGEPLRCRQVVVAMGPWSVLAEDWLGVQCVPLEGIKSASVVYNSEVVRAAVSAAPYALFCNEDSRFGTHLEVYPRNNGEIYVCGIGGSDYVSGARLRPGGDTESQAMVAADPKRVAAARGALKGMTSLAAGEPDIKQACMRPCAPDALPIMGAVPGVSNAFLACGHNCWGILWAPVSGLAMSELLVDGAAKCVDLAAFSPARFVRRASGGRGRKQGTASVGEQW